jgi:hypothetical protein
MPWLRSGTVSCTLNSSTVTGASTGFAANARVGDAFLGPDGRWYEVANIASDTVLSILPPYVGPTVAAGAYALAPMQGYVKASADALRALVNQFGAVLAVLGTNATAEGIRAALGVGAVATENTLPVKKGGTGGTTVAEAQKGLGLGTAAIANIGNRSGQVLAVPAFGIGKREDVGNTSIMPSMNVWETSFGVIADGTQYRPITYGVCLNLAFPGAGYLGAQLYMGTSPGGFIGFRSGDYSGTQPGGGFNTIYHTGNTTRAADGTLKAI